MIALQLTDVKTFMNQLLCSELFDRFLLSEASITKDATFTVNGHINPAFYSAEELETEGLTGLDILPYSRLRPVCYQLIRGKHTPVTIKFDQTLSPENMKHTLARSDSSFTDNDVKGIFINLAFQNGRLTLTTGISYILFSTDRTLDHEWDGLIKKFLAKNSVSYEEL